MSFNMLTDSEFDQALATLANRFGKSKAQVVRDLVLQASARQTEQLPFGVFARHLESHSGVKDIVRALKALDEDLAL